MRSKYTLRSRTKFVDGRYCLAERIWRENASHILGKDSAWSISVAAAAALNLFGFHHDVATIVTAWLSTSTLSVHPGNKNSKWAYRTLDGIHKHPAVETPYLCCAVFQALRRDTGDADTSR